MVEQDSTTLFPFPVALMGCKTPVQGTDIGVKSTQGKLVRFFVPGRPAPGGSKTGFYIKKIGRVVMTPANKKTKPWMGIVSAFAREAYQGELLLGALRLQLEFHLLRPKKHYGTGRNASVMKASAPIYSTIRPDLTKLERSTEDALVGIIMQDDSQVAVKATKKIYVERDEGVLVTVEQLENTFI